MTETATRRRHHRGSRQFRGQGQRLRGRQRYIYSDRGFGDRGNKDRIDHTIEIERFVPKAQIDERYADSPYYLVPTDKSGLDAYSVIRDAMHDQSMAALGRVVISKRERVIMLQPWGRGLLGTTLRYPYEVRGEEVYFAEIPEIKIPKDMLALAEHILESKKADFDPSQFNDRYEQAIVEMINVKKAGMPPALQKPPAPRIVGGTDLMAVLRQSMKQIEDEDWEGGAKPKAAKAPATANANRRRRARSGQAQS